MFMVESEGKIAKQDQSEKPFFNRIEKTNEKLRGFMKRYGIIIFLLASVVNWISSVVTFTIFECRIKKIINKSPIK